MFAHILPQILKGLPDLTLPTALQNNFTGGPWNIAMGKVGKVGYGPQKEERKHIY